uniref:Uncharacterized protein n=1 Tax=Anguilla anguilla TaxID=7936 RepID=A0A0E9WV63_ANGAN
MSKRILLYFIQVKKNCSAHIEYTSQDEQMLFSSLFSSFCSQTEMQWKAKNKTKARMASSA